MNQQIFPTQVKSGSASNKTFLGRPVIFCDEDSVAFCYDLFTMIEQSFGPSHFMRTDQACAYHFAELRKRLAELSCADDCERWVTVGLGEAPSDDECTKTP